MDDERPRSADALEAGAAAAASSRRSSTRSRPSRTRAGERSATERRHASSSSRASTTCSSSRTIRTASSATRASAPPTLFELDGGERVTYSSSFSKTIAPGLRVGYVRPARGARARARGARDLDVHHARAARPGDGASSSSAAAASSRTSSACARPARRQARRDARGARARAPGARWSAARGRLLHLARAPEGTDATRCSTCGRGGRHLRARAATSAGAPNTARLAFSFVSLDEIREGVRSSQRLVPVSVQAAAACGEVAQTGAARGAAGAAGRSEPRLCSRNVGQGRVGRQSAEPGATEVAILAGQVVPLGHGFVCLSRFWGRSDKAVILRGQPAQVKVVAAEN